MMIFFFCGVFKRVVFKLKLVIVNDGIGGPLIGLGLAVVGSIGWGDDSSIVIVIAIIAAVI